MSGKEKNPQPENKQARTKPPQWRGQTAIYSLLIGALVSGVALGSYTFFSAGNGLIPTGTGTTTSQSSQPSPAQERAGNTTQSYANNVADPTHEGFSEATAGTCLTWEYTEDKGTLSAFGVVDCAQPHRFEVSARQDLASYPTSEFGTKASPPDVTRQAELREELCRQPTLNYLDGRFDPNGLYSIASILPSQEAWESGDRTLLCGVQTTDSQGVIQLTSGPIAQNDQSRVAESGQCLRLSAGDAVSVVECSEDHHFEVISTENLGEVFPDHTPTPEEQDRHLRQVCADAAINYVGDSEALYQTTLTPVWFDIAPESWNGGSHRTNCLLFANVDGHQGVLRGTAKDGREGISVDGAAPTVPPERPPLPSTTAESAPEPTP